MSSEPASSSSSSSSPAEEAIQRVQAATTHYETLGVSKDDADDKTLKKAYRKLALLLHPDKCQLEGSEQAFQKVNNAYACLSQPDTKSHYDRFGSDAPAGGPGGGMGGVDPNDFFRDFMAQNPDFAAGFQAGAPQGATTFNFADFNFTAGSLAAGRSWWKTKAETLEPTWLRPPFKALGVVVFGIMSGFLYTMPYSAMIIGGIMAYLASQVIWWIMNRLIWIIAMYNLPPQIVKYLPFPIQILILLGVEYMGVELDFQRGFLCYVMLASSQRLFAPNNPQQQQQPQAGPSGFSFHMGGPGGMSFQSGPGFVQFGAMPGMRPPPGRVGVQQQGSQQRQRVHR